MNAPVPPEWCGLIRFGIFFFAAVVVEMTEQQFFGNGNGLI